MGRWKFTPGNTVALIAAIARRARFDRTKQNLSQKAIQWFARSAVGKQLHETGSPSSIV